MPTFSLRPDSPLCARLGDARDWTLVPLRIPTGWSVRWNGLDARRLATGEVEINDSEDILWLTKLPPPDTGAYATDPTSQWRELHLDVGWYRDCFRVAVLDPDWDHVLSRFDETDPDALLERVERWLASRPA